MEVKTIIRFLAIILAALITASVVAVTAFAATTDAAFEIEIYENGVNIENNNPRRLKEDNSSVYVNYAETLSGAAATGPESFIAYVYGSIGYGPLVDCSSYSNTGVAQKRAVVMLGTKGYIKNWAIEKFGTDNTVRVQLYGREHDGHTGTAVGKWSADSIYESGTVNYN